MNGPQRTAVSHKELRGEWKQKHLKPAYVMDVEYGMTNKNNLRLLHNND